MPLLDHFRSPLRGTRRWEGFWSHLTCAIATRLNGPLLPESFVALPLVEISSPTDEDEPEPREAPAYRAPSPRLTIQADLNPVDVFEVTVYAKQDGRKRVAAVELISPAHKTRPTQRRAFVRKCATLLQKGVAVVVIDIVTEHGGNLHADILRTLAPDTVVDAAKRDALYAAAYRPVVTKGKSHLEVWSEDLVLGKPLPTLPLWIAPDVAVPLELEETYRTTCASLRIPLP